MAKLEIAAPAKINIGLYITRKREDGFHDIETIFYPIILSDKIIIEDSNRFYFTSSKKTLQNHTNLIVRAKKLVEEYSGKRLEYKIHLEKKIPLGAGLGGGSSDAAAVLKGLNTFSGLNLSGQDLLNLALKLGSDIPFFLDPQPAFAGGRGEVIKPLSFHIEQPIILVNSGIQVSSAWAYSKIKPKEHELDLRKIKSLDLNNLKQLSGRLENDFEKVVFDKYPRVKEIKSMHYDLGAVFSLMSGSGSTVFGIYPDESTASNAAKILKEKKYFVFIHSESNAS
jgi:4-diphosphocytidyl-2-C-methyl-D-erythritol kinase